MKRKNVLLVVALTFCALATAGLARAETLLLDDGQARLRLTTNTQATGYDFTVGANPLEVTALGVWDDDADDVASTEDGETGGTPDGLGDDCVARLFEQTSATTGVKLAEVTIPAGTGGYLVGEFRYADLSSPVTLEAGKTYQISTHFTADPDVDLFHHFTMADGSNTYVVSPDIVGDSLVARFLSNINKDQYMFGYAANNATTASNHAFIHGNMIYNVIPEPAAAMMLLGLAGMALTRKRNT